MSKPTHEQLKTEHDNLRSKMDVNTGARNVLYPLRKAIIDRLDLLEMDEKNIKSRMREISAILEYARNES